MIWKKISAEKNDKGEKTIVYATGDPPNPLRIESRTRAIEHAGGNAGYTGLNYWLHTTYVFIDFYGNEHPANTFKEAKELAEKLEVAE